ncbi:DUF4240 domain-containing protein [Actinokineospora sp. UTMC 2448]|uniref:DUF4240 domain-containing protein n=1 Tax=Actinokineospora sp. UTMC 2448 TaxID=2268449 RepID=UPI0021643E13|nr:DUF4240 domain-containing protein [Actinokineospora sp. UTMC 2448]UVS78347.1 hypothetical protein Actkin_02079 [Actinokineospora sp. UTMC 2448]
MTMTAAAFWELLGRAAERPTERERTEFVVTELGRLPRASAVDFHRHLVAARVDTPGLRAAARVVLGRRLGDDAYWDFQPWLLSLGRTAVERALADPDSLADVPRVRALAGGWAVADQPAWPSLARAVLEVCGLDCECFPAPDDGPEPPLPRLAALFDTPIRPVRKETDAEVVTVVW